MSNYENWTLISKYKSKTNSKTSTASTASATSTASAASTTCNARKKKHRVKPHKNINKGELWGEPTGWTKSYHCEVCFVLLSKKDAARNPQVIYACNHLVCGKCIVKSYLVDLNPICPVPNCGIVINPKDEIPISQSPGSDIRVENICKYCSDCCEDCICDLLKTDYRTEPIGEEHYCGDWICPGDCGVLICGCIDICRGR